MWVMPSMSRPLAATSVATSKLRRPVLKSLMARSRWACVKPACRAWTRKPFLYIWSETRLVSRRVRQKIMAFSTLSWRKMLQRASNLPCWLMTV